MPLTISETTATKMLWMIQAAIIPDWLYQVTDAATEKHLQLHWCSVWPKNKPKNKNPTMRYILLQHANQIPAAKRIKH